MKTYEEYMAQLPPDTYIAVHEDGQEYFDQNYPEPDMTEEELPFTIECTTCRRVYIFNVNVEKMQTFLSKGGPHVYLRKSGPHVQDLFPYMHPDVRELMISQTCGHCFNKMFNSDEEE